MINVYCTISTRRTLPPTLTALDAVRAVKRLWRSSYKSYFSWLPREIVVYIQTLGHFLTAPRQTWHCPKSS